MTPTQVDREAAAELAWCSTEAEILALFTRHRLTAEAAAFEKAAGVARMVGERAEKLCLDGEVTEARVAVSLAAEIIGDGIAHLRKLAGEKHD